MSNDLLKAFDALLEKTVTSSRLSGSKVKDLQELALKAVAHDHHLVTSLLKLNTSLPPASTARISSLYVFDAIARAAKAASKGTHTSVSTERGRGNPASLLAKMEGVVDEWIQGMVDDGKGGVWSDGRDKTRKVVEIWRKGSTFPDSCVTRSTTPVEPPPFHLIERYARTMGGTPESRSPAPQQQQGQLPPEIMAMLGVKDKDPQPQSAPVSRQSNPALDAVLANVRKPSAPNLDTASLAALANLGATLGQQAPHAQYSHASGPAQSLPPRPNVVTAENGSVRVLPSVGGTGTHESGTTAAVLGTRVICATTIHDAGVGIVMHTTATATAPAPLQGTTGTIAIREVRSNGNTHLANIVGIPATVSVSTAITDVIETWAPAIVKRMIRVTRRVAVTHDSAISNPTFEGPATPVAATPVTDTAIIPTTAPAARRREARYLPNPTDYRLAPHHLAPTLHCLARCPATCLMSETSLRAVVPLATSSPLALAWAGAAGRRSKRLTGRHSTPVTGGVGHRLARRGVRRRGASRTRWSSCSSWSRR
ncbi:uncharacterized protein COLE_00179 [Cutaneotrichosporon oleaginosum]|uniref:uncharacterized protein n=1 Tax=Cutaneotrichosporon oleaginosum TaxID=879819 RepID=UPI0013230A32|nr:hypothetical protein COLE_00179 [Cutaneotrichosporon oleaginosum]